MVVLRALHLQDVRQAIKLSNAERWNQTEKDWKFLIENPWNICLAAAVGEKVIGTVTAINYEEDVGWIGMVLVDKEFRGRGVSKLLLSGIIERQLFSRSLKLDATPAGESVYQGFGFEAEYLIHRMTIASVSMQTVSFDYELLLERANLKNILEIVEYDKSVFGAPRQKLIEFLIKNHRENVWTLKKNGQITGFALGRKGARFCQIGPVVALNNEDAKKLIAKSLTGLLGQPVVVDILDDKKDLINWLSSIGFKVQRSFVRMYRNENLFPGIPVNQYLICGPEFG